MKNDEQRICIVTFPTKPRGLKPIRQLIAILKELRTEINIISGSQVDDFELEKSFKIPFFKITHKSQKNHLKRIISYTITQISICIAIFKLRKSVDLYMFFLGGETLILPHLLVKLLNRQTVFILSAFSSKGSEYMKDPLNMPEAIMTKINFYMADRLLIYSKSIVEERNLYKFKNKIRFVIHHFLRKCEIKYINIESRGKTIGFLGALNENKGILNLLSALKILMSKGENYHLHIGGAGKQVFVKKIKDYIINNDLEEYVTFHGWIKRDKVPLFLSQIKFFVLPSLTEGLPNALIEAMGCGCCVISTKVGGIPNLIESGKEGFLIENNHPISIYNIIMDMRNYNLAKISENARKKIKNDFSFEKCVESFKIALDLL